MDDLHGFHHVALTVRDCDASASWYGSVLGMVEHFREERPGRKACIMRFPGGDFSVGVIEYSDGPDAGFDPHHRGLDHLAFTVGSRDDMQAWATRLTQAGVTHSGIIDIPQGQILNFKDPDDIALALFCDDV